MAGGEVAKIRTFYNCNDNHNSGYRLHQIGPASITLASPIQLFYVLFAEMCHRHVPTGLVYNSLRYASPVLYLVKPARS